ncbi:hypothetical protein G6F48_009365 [Rhizopus delemar]|nr:hypothetical protein G6F48_009365 [Rhizopus delemar]
MQTERSIQDYSKPNWGHFRRHTSQKITPLVHFYEKSAAVQKDVHPKEPIEASLERLEPPKDSSGPEEEQDGEEGRVTEKKKSQTCPNLSLCAPDRPLPPLPTERKRRMTRAISKGQMHLKRTTTWIGLPVQRWLASPPLQHLGVMMSKRSPSAAENIVQTQSQWPPTASETGQEEDGLCSDKEFVYQTNHDHCTFIRNQVQAHDSKEHALDASNKKVFVAPKRFMHCRGSDRECEYELSLYHNGQEQSTQTGTLHKIDKHLSADRPQAEAVRFEIQEPFSLTFAVAARYTNTRLRDGLAKMGLWTPQAKPPGRKHLSPAGFSVLTFESKQDTQHHGITRFKLTKADEQRKTFSTWFHVELVVDMKVIEALPDTVQKFPWASTLTDPIARQDQPDPILQDPAQVQLSQQHCVAGDYLTLYTRGIAHPAWKRYWASLEGTRLMLYDFTYKTTREPLSTISLMPLRWVSKPSLDDCEQVGIARKMGVMLQFDRLKAIFSEDVHFDDGEHLNGKAFFYCDDEINATHWRRALTAHVASTVKSDENEGGVDLRFLW